MQERRDQAQVGGNGRLRGQQGQNRLVDLQVATVDHVVVRDDQLGELGVAMLDRLDGAVELVDDEVEAPESPRLQLLELLVIFSASAASAQPNRPLT